MKIFNLYDRKAGAPVRGFFSINAQTALRDLSELIEENKIPHFVDLELFETGDQNDETMEIIGNVPKHLMNLAELGPVEHNENG